MVNGQVTGLLLLDLSSAFDTVDHPTLLSVLSSRFGIADGVLDWFESYLTGGTQTFIYGDARSATQAVDCSVPQGSGLGPQEFICYTEDVSCVFDRNQVNHHLFADDKQMYASGSVGRYPTTTTHCLRW